MENKKEKGNWIYIAIGIVILIVLGTYWSEFNGELSSEINDWSGFGSYVGGVLGSALTLITLIIVIRTYRLQSTELTLTREVHSGTQKILSQQRFENTFFNLLNEKNSLLNSTTGGKTFRQLLLENANTFTTHIDNRRLIVEGDLTTSIQNIRNDFLQLRFNEYKSILKINDSLYRLIEQSGLDEKEENFYIELVVGSMAAGDIEFYLCYSLTQESPSWIYNSIYKSNLLNERLSNPRWEPIRGHIQTYLEESDLIPKQP